MVSYRIHRRFRRTPIDILSDSCRVPSGSYKRPTRFRKDVMGFLYGSGGSYRMFIGFRRDLIGFLQGSIGIMLDSYRLPYGSHRVPMGLRWDPIGLR